MKKTLYTAILLGGLGLVSQASGQFSNAGVINVTGQGSLTATEVNTTGKWDSAAGSGSKQFTLSDDTVVTHTKDGGQCWTYPIPATSTSLDAVAPALTQMNADLGTHITANELKSVGYIASGNSTSSLKLDFTNNAIYTEGSRVVLYFTLASDQTNPGVSVTSNSNAFTLSYATSSSPEFTSSLTDGGFSYTARDLVLVRAEGRLGASQMLTISATPKTTGFGMVAYIPEPATATLSLLALAGLAARRRRK